VIAYRARSESEPETAWALVARPSRWHEWAPHLRGAWGLGEPEVVPGARGAARLLGVVPVPAVVTEKRPGESWTWRVGPVSMVHAVHRRRSGCEVAVEMHASPALEAALALSYGPVVALLVKRLAAVAAARGDLS
jgi:hypothetical protein